MKRIIESIDKKKLGKVFIWIGVSAWFPFIYLWITGNKPPLFPYLITHLTGILTGINLSRSDKKESGAYGERRIKLSKIMIYFGVISWIPYIFLTNILGREVVITPYLSCHLLGVLGGIAVRLSVVIGEHKLNKLV
jgi:hypothetical protein